MPLLRRIPKFGFTNIFKKRYSIVKIGDRSIFEPNSVVDFAALAEAGLVDKVLDGVKVLADGELKIPVTLKVDKVSAAAKIKIEAAGGKVETE